MSTPPPLPELKFAAIPAEARGRYTGDRFSYMEAGKAGSPPVVLLHGVGANSMYWRFQLAALADTYRVIAWNAPGYVLSDNLIEDAPGCRADADALVDFAAALGLARFRIVGNSFGTRVAQCFAHHHPGRVIKMALSGTGIARRGMMEAARAEIIAGRERQIEGCGHLPEIEAPAAVNALLREFLANRPDLSRAARREPG